MTIPASYHSVLIHPWHRRLYQLSAVLSLSLLAVAIVVLVLVARGHTDLFDEASPFYRVVSIAVPLALVVPGFLGFARLLASSKPTLEGVTVGPDQFPEIYRTAQDICSVTGQQMPTIVIATGSRDLCACHSLFGHHIVVLHSDLIEAERAHPFNYVVARFELARAMGLLASGERRFIAQFLTIVPSTVPYLSRILARSEHCTADRWGAFLVPEGAAPYFAFDAVGKVLWPRINIARLNDVARESKRCDTMSSWFMDKPPLPWRISGLAATGVFSLAELRGLTPAPASSLGDVCESRMAAMDFSHATAFWRKPSPVDGSEPQRYTSCTVDELLDGLQRDGLR